MTELLEDMVRIAAEASALVNEIYAKPFSVEYKAPRDPVTEADRRANRLICVRLHERYPDVPVVAEESDEASFAGFREAPRVFFVDPVDGTREFVERNGEFVVMIGLLEGDRASHGVVQAPARGWTWVGQVGRGAWTIGPDASRQPIRCSETINLAEASIVGSRSHKSQTLERARRALGAAHWRSLGSAGLKAAAVASGEADAYIAPNRAGKRWDACAPDAIVTAAGGCFTDQNGAPISYRAPSLVNDRGLVATNHHLHRAVIERLTAELGRLD